MNLIENCVFYLWEFYEVLRYKNPNFDLIKVTCGDQLHDLSLTFSSFLSIISFLKLNIRTIPLVSHKLVSELQLFIFSVFFFISILSIFYLYFRLILGSDAKNAPQLNVYYKLFVYKFVSQMKRKFKENFEERKWKEKEKDKV